MGEHLILSQLTDHEADMLLDLLEGLLVGVDQKLLEVAVDHLALHLLEVPDELEEVLFHEFVDES